MDTAVARSNLPGPWHVKDLANAFAVPQVRAAARRPNRLSIKNKFRKKQVHARRGSTYIRGVVMPDRPELHCPVFAPADHIARLIKACPSMDHKHTPTKTWPRCQTRRSRERPPCVLNQVKKKEEEEEEEEEEERKRRKNRQSRCHYKKKNTRFQASVHVPEKVPSLSC